MPPRGGQRPALSDAQATAALSGLLAGNQFPLSQRLRQLNGSWRRFNVSGQYEMGLWMQMYSSMLGGSFKDVYYTRGQVVTLGGENYIVAYRPQTKNKPMDFAALIRMGSTPQAKPPAPEKMTPDTLLSLSLLNLRTIGSLNNIRPFNLSTELELNNSGSGNNNGNGSRSAPSATTFGTTTGTATRAASGASTSTNATSTGTTARATTARGVSAGGTSAATAARSANAAVDARLRQLGLALMMYVQDHDEVLPDMSSAAAAKKALMPYVKDESVFLHPITKKVFEPNPALSKKKLAHIVNPRAFLAFYEDTTAPDGTRGLLFLDGRPKRIQEKEWPQVARDSKVLEAKAKAGVSITP
ncbi:MAG: hypothetical protein JWN98_875 [Abditibacteriota bacterium]|nr:hypothetical protein [Abditibacteriota bacterium]